LILALEEHPAGVVTACGNHVVYSLQTNQAHFGAAHVTGPSLVWTLVRDPGPGEWLLRCDRVDFPPGGVAHRHVHPGPGIRRILHGELTIARDDAAHTYRAGESWFEDADDPVTATASASEETAFVRVLLLPREWAGKRTIRYVDPADEEKPKLQRATVLLEEPVAP
jgi:quercetin dioxygenase-like cupin family protein